MRIRRNILLGILLGVVAGLVMNLFNPHLRPLFTLEYWQSVHRFATVLRMMETEHVNPDQWSMKEVTDSALQAMLGSIDPYAGLMTGQGFQSFIDANNQRYVGIGVEVTFRNDKLTVLAPFDGGPAQRAGIFPGDEIVKIDDDPIQGVEFHKVIERLRGEPGTSVKLHIFRASNGETLEFTLERQSIAVNTVTGAEFLEPGIGYLRISRFSEKTEQEFVDQLARFQEQGLKGLVIDLRNNPGGILQVCLKLLGHFYPKDEVLLRIVAPTKGVDLPQYNEMNGSKPDYQIAILIDEASASASEIMAANMQESGIAKLFGQPSFGKTTVQSIFKLGNSDAVKLTTALYLTPGGMDIAEDGVVPDVETEMSAEDSAQIFLQKLIGTHMSRELFEERFGVSWKEDVTLAKALEWLKGNDTGN